MPRKKVLALILAGGEGSRLEILTARRAKPAMPFAGVYRLIDFALSNCVHSQVSNVWVIEQYELHSLNEHLANGRPWDLDRTYGGLQVLPPYQRKIREEEGGFAEGNADAIYRHKGLIREFGADVLLVLSADAIYKMDYRDAIDRHLEDGADVTLVTTRVPREEAGRFGVVEVDGNGKITGFEYKPESPKSDLVTTEVFVYDARRLLEALDRLADEGKEKDGDEPPLKDFGHELIPSLVREGRALDFRFEGYWRDVGTIESYWQAHRDLLEPEPRLVLDDPGWPILTYGTQRLPARIEGSARIDGSLIAPGCRIAGRVERSVLAPGVVVEEGAEVRDSILLHGTVVGKEASVVRAILDADVRVGEGACVGEAEGELVLAGQRAGIAAGDRIPAGGRVEAEDGAPR
ncbi:MAG TPA: glucose-1-phosphate adenylyltransferase family protein [Thermoanaerobaculia bacterium]|nr:glucose-1-phosphate adenylyltransferase family protein [Thermoanaerobaculia bacterium]